MIEHAKRVFWLGTTVGGGNITQKTHLERVAQQAGRPPEDFWKIPDCPPEVGYLFGWFTELKTSAEPLTFVEIQAWADLTARFPTPAEVGVLFQLDREVAELQKKMTN